MGALVADVELAVGGLVEAFRTSDDHAADGVPALNMRVVIDLDTFRRGVQPEQVGKLAEKTALRSGIGKMASQRFLGIVAGHGGQLGPVPALRAAQLDVAPGA